MTLQELLADYKCDFMTDQCNARNFAKTLQLENDEEMCKKVCCIGCDEVCGYRCGYALDTVKELKQYCDE